MTGLRLKQKTVAAHHDASAADADDTVNQAKPSQPTPTNRLRPADHKTTEPRNTMAAGTVFMVIIGALAAAALLNAEVMLRRAETSELGTSRDAALAVWRPIEAVGSRLGLGTSRARVDAFRDRDASGDDGFVLAAGPAPGRLGHRAYRPERGPALPAGPTIEKPGIETPLGLPPSEHGAEAGSTTPATAPGSTAGLEARPSATSAPLTPTETTAGAEETALLRRPTEDDPLRVLVIGDSTMDAVGNSILRDLADTGVTDAQLDVRVSTGLSRPDFFDWPTHLRAVTATHDTELVIVMMGANDAQPFMIADSPESYGTPAWFEAYRQRVASLLHDLTVDGGWVLWIGQPIMRKADFDAKMRDLNQIYVEELNRYPTAAYLNPRPIMSDENGAYGAYLDDVSGNRILVRQADGMHLTPDGGDRLAPLVIAEINAIAPLG